MTVASETSRVQYAGNDVTTSFSVPFYFLANGDLKVVLTSTTGVESTLTITTHYTLSGAGVPAGGTLTMVTAPATGEYLTIYRDPAVTQETDFVENDPLPAAALEGMGDRLTMIAQRLKNILSRTFRLSDADTSGASTVIPAPEALQLLGWNEDGDELVNYSAADIATVAATGTYYVDVFSGTGAQTAFTLSASPGTKNNTMVYVGGVYQQKSTYSLSGTTLTFSVAPALGTNNIEVQHIRAIDGGVGTPADGSVSTSSLASGLLVPVSKGGTGATTFTAGTLLLGNGTSAVQELEFGAARQFAVSDGSTWYSRAIQGDDLPTIPVAKLPTATDSAQGAMEIATAAEVKAASSTSAVAVVPGTMINHPLMPKAVAQFSSSALTADMLGNVTFDSYTKDNVANTITVRLSFSGVPAFVAAPRNFTVVGACAIASLESSTRVDGNTLDIVFRYWDNGIGDGGDTWVNGVIALYCNG